MHGALSAAADDLGLVELEAWHAAKATMGTDPQVADRLERVADLAGSRGGFSSRASVLAQASTLTPPGRSKYARLVAAAEAALAAGAAQLAKSLLDDVDEDSLDPVSRGRLIAAARRLAIFTADPALMLAGADMLAAAESFHGHDADAGAERPDQGVRVHAARPSGWHRASPSRAGQPAREGAELQDGPGGDPPAGAERAHPAPLRRGGAGHAGRRRRPRRDGRRRSCCSTARSAWP